LQGDRERTGDGDSDGEARRESWWFHERPPAGLIGLTGEEIGAACGV
jgi:hypothetical protein